MCIIYTSVIIHIVTICALTWPSEAQPRILVTPLSAGLKHSLSSLAGLTAEDSVVHFIQSEPKADSVSAEATAVKLFADNEQLYVIIWSYDSKPDAIIAPVVPRDEIAGDRIGVYLTGFGDNETGYLFRVNAANVQSDATVNDDGRNADYSWDGVWYSEVTRNDQGWCAYLKIPFKTMHFRPGVIWRIGFVRYIPRLVEFSWWPAIKVEQGMRMSALAVLEGLVPGRPGLNLEFFPTAMIKYDRGVDNKYAADAGADLSWSPSSSSVLSLTGNPDFAQIESDPDRINIGRYETYLYEKRPFFVEDAGRFQTPINLYYSRRIGKRLLDGQEVPIYGAVKYHGSFGRYSIAALGAVCGKVEYQDWYGNNCIEPQTAYTVLRVSKGVGKNSSLGTFFGAKENSNNYNRLYGVDGVWRRRDMKLSTQAVLSQRFGSANGFAYQASFNRNAHSYYLSASSLLRDSLFYANGLGYLTFSGDQHSVTAGPVWRQKGQFTYVSFLMTGSLYRLTGDPRYSKSVTWNVNPNLKHIGSSMSIRYNMQYEMGVWYNFWTFDFWFWRNSEGRINISPGFGYTNWTYNYYRGYFAPNGYASLYASCRLRENIDVTWQGNYTAEWKPDRSIEETSWIHEVWFRWSLRHDFHFKVYYTPNLNTHIHKINLLFSYNYRPKSWLYLALNEMVDNSSGSPRTTDRIISLKLSRLIWW